MTEESSEQLVVGIASSALFDLSESDEVFRTRGESAYRDYQEQNLDNTLQPGIAFPFIKRLLSLNDLATGGTPLVDVIVLSRNDPDTGLRVMRSIGTHHLPITRAVFMQGRSPYAFMPAFNMTLFLSANEQDVRKAIMLGLPAGQVIGAPAASQEGTDLRIAFDFDGVLADDSSEQIMQSSGLDRFREHETINALNPIASGPLRDFLASINRIQDLEEEREREDQSYDRRVHVAIVTARDAPANERVIHTLKHWGVRVNDAFFLGGIEKGKILAILRPHIFFDDQLRHISSAAGVVPSVHIPFGAGNRGRD